LRLGPILGGERVPNVIDKEQKITIRSPSSIANIGPGFDVISMAIEGLQDTVIISARKGDGLIKVSSRGFNVPSGPGNVAYHVASEFCRKYGIRNSDIHIEIIKGVPPALGLGSSAATSAAVAYGLSLLFDIKLNRKELVMLAGIGEKYASGSAHYDNVAASLFGGFVIVDAETGEVYQKIPSITIPVAIVSPLVNYSSEHRKTEYARSILPQNILLSDHVKQSSALAKLVYGIMSDDLRLIGEAVSQDYIVEKHRAKLIPFYYELKKLAIDNGCLGFNIAGAGPSVFLIHESMEKAESAAKMLSYFLQSKRVAARTFTTRVSSKGTTWSYD